MIPLFGYHQTGNGFLALMLLVAALAVSGLAYMVLVEHPRSMEENRLLIERIKLKEIQKKKSCVERGGTVHEIGHGWNPGWDCIGAKRFE